MNKAELIATAKTQWAATEASIARAAKGKFETRPSADDWSAAEIYRHIIHTVHRLPEAMDQLVRGEPLTALRPGDPEGLTDFASLNAQMLGVELNTAHGIAWMALQKLSDADFGKEVELMGNKRRLEDLIPVFVVGHEQSHVEQALKAAGVS